MILMEKNAGITEGAEDKLQITFQKLMGSSCALATDTWPKLLAFTNMETHVHGK